MWETKQWPQCGVCCFLLALPLFAPGAAVQAGAADLWPEQASKNSSTIMQHEEVCFLHLSPEALCLGMVATKARFTPLSH